MSVGHARAAFSALHLTVPCPGSLQLQERMPPQPSTDEDREGTAAHYVATTMASGRAWKLGDTFESEGQTWTVDIEMLNGARLFRDVCDKMMPLVLRVEDTVSASRIHPTDCWGTPDAFTYDVGLKYLKIPEYKYGHRYVEVFENYQLSAQAEGVIERLNLGDDEITVELIVVQPRSYHKDGPVRRWRIKRSRLNPVTALVRDQVALALGLNPPTAVGEQCLDCKARQACVTLGRTTAHVVDYAGSAELVDLPDAALGAELRLVRDAQQRLKARETGLAMQAEKRLREGGTVPWFGLEATAARLTWNEGVTVDDLRGMGQAFGVELLNPVEPITPTQAKASGLDEAVISLYSSRKSGAMKLVAVNNTAAKKVFSK